MKLFFKYIIIVVTSVLVVYSGIVAFSWYLIRHNTDLKADDNVTVAVFGNSVCACSINEFFIPNWKNFACSGVDYKLEFPFIREVVRQNPQIDTLLIGLGECNYSMYDNDSYNDRDDAIPFFRDFSGYVAFLGSDIFKDYSLKEIMACAIGNNVGSYESPRYGYLFIDRHNITSGEWSEAWYDSVYANSNACPPYSEAKIKYSISFDQIRNIVSWCQEQGKTVVIYNPPLYKSYKWFDPKPYKDFLRTLGPDLLVADYTNFSFPDSTYYGDVRHVNYQGAEYLSSHIKNNGLKMTTVKDYCEK